MKKIITSAAGQFNPDKTGAKLSSAWFCLSFLIFNFPLLIGNAQNIAINTTGVAAAPAAILDIASTNQGLLIPRVSLADVFVYGLTAPAVNSLLVFSNTAPASGNGVGFYYWDVSVTRWQALNTGVAGPAGPAGPPGPASGSSTTTSLDEDAMVWSVLSGTPATVAAGGHLVSTGNDSLFAIRGRSVTTFYLYRISTNSWITKTAAPGSFSSGSALVFTGYSSGGYIYALQGGGAAGNLYRYEISSNTWAPMLAAPGAIALGGAMIYGGGDYIYVLQGSSTVFYRYSISGNSWTTMTATPATVQAGASLVYTGGDHIYMQRGNGALDFYRYSISLNTWTVIASVPSAPGAGGALTYTGGNYIYMTKGAFTTNFYRYSISLNSWTTMISSINTIDVGGALAYGGGDYVYVLRGNTSTDFYRVKVKGVWGWQPWIR